jgi:hypothetical protein
MPEITPNSSPEGILRHLERIRLSHEPSDPEPDNSQEIRTAINWLDRSRIVKLLESASIHCGDDEDLEELKDALFENIEDGTIPSSEVLD